MSTRRQTDWGGGDVRSENPILGSSPSGASEQLFGVMQNFVRLPGYGKMLAKGKAGDLSGGVQGGIDIDRVNRSMLGPLYGRTTGGYTFTLAAWTEVDPVLLAGKMVCTGRPVRVDISSGLNKGAATAIIVSVTMDGTEISGKADGLMWNYTANDLFVTGWRVLTPPAGIHRFALVAFMSGVGTGSMYSDASDTVSMIVMEI